MSRDHIGRLIPTWSRLHAVHQSSLNRFVCRTRFALITVLLHSQQSRLTVYRSSAWLIGRAGLSTLEQPREVVCGSFCGRAICYLAVLADVVDLFLRRRTHPFLSFARAAATPPASSSSPLLPGGARSDVDGPAPDPSRALASCSAVCFDSAIAAASSASSSSSSSSPAIWNCLALFACCWPCSPALVSPWLLAAANSATSLSGTLPRGLATSRFLLLWTSASVLCSVSSLLLADFFTLKGSSTAFVHALTFFSPQPPMTPMVSGSALMAALRLPKVLTRATASVLLTDLGTVTNSTSLSAYEVAWAPLMAAKFACS